MSHWRSNRRTDQTPVATIVGGVTGLAVATSRSAGLDVVVTGLAPPRPFPEGHANSHRLEVGVRPRHR